MPTAAPRACPVQGCPSLVTRERPCPTHPRRAWATTRRSATARGYGVFWQGARRAVLMHEPLCRPCTAAGRVSAATEVDHIIPKARGGTDDLDNLQPICDACHARKSAAEGRR
jgi:5-methylcytosine-specific restriction protein A